MGIKIPQYQRQVEPQVGTVPSPEFPTPVRAAFGEQAAEAEGGISKVTGQLADLLGKHAERKLRAKNERQLSALETQSMQFGDDLKFSTEEEKYIDASGQEQTRQRGFMNQTGTHAENATQRLDQAWGGHAKSQLDQISSQEYRDRYAKSLMAQHRSLRNAAISHEARQDTLVTDQLNKTALEGYINKAALVNNPEEWGDLMVLARDKMNHWMSDKGMPQEVADQAMKEYIKRGLTAATETSFQRDISGGQAIDILDYAKKEGFIDEAEYKDHKEGLGAMAKKQLELDNLGQYLATSKLTAERDALRKEGKLDKVTLDAMYAANPNTFSEKDYKAEMKIIESNRSGAGSPLMYNNIVEELIKVLGKDALTPKKMKTLNKRNEYDNVLELHSQALTALAENDLTQDQYDELNKWFGAATTENIKFAKTFSAHATNLDDISFFAKEMTSANWRRLHTKDGIIPIKQLTDDLTQQMYAAYLDRVTHGGKIMTTDKAKGKQEALFVAHEIKKAFSREVALMTHTIVTDEEGKKDYVKQGGAFYEVINYTDGVPMVKMDDVESDIKGEEKRESAFVPGSYEVLEKEKQKKEKDLKKMDYYLKKGIRPLI